MDKLSYFLFLIIKSLVAILPFRLLYVFADLVYFILYHIIGYRKQVVHDNLVKCFPDKSPEEIQKIMKGSYRNLSDVLVEGIKGFSISKKSILKRFILTNPEVLNAYLLNKKSVIVCPTHYTNWEWGALSPAMMVEGRVVVLYKALSNKYIDRLLIKSREKFGSELVALERTFRVFAESKKTPAVYVMAADQSPGKIEKAIWIRFLNRDTAVIHGVEKYAQLFDMDVFFGNIQRVKRGYYELTIEPLVYNPKDAKTGEITTKYMGRLEEIIRQNPDNWLWSHRRWKHQPPKSNKQASP